MPSRTVHLCGTGCLQGYCATSNAMVSIAEQLERLLMRHLSEDRLAHSRRVADLARRLCTTHGLDGEKGEIAGLAHDWARELPLERMRRLALQDGGGESDLEARYPVLLHGRAAAAGMREILAIEDPDILQAVACHVTGCPGMGLLAKIVFVADFLEPGRGFLPEELRRGMLRMDIDRMTLHVLEEIFGYLRSRERPIAPPALLLARELRSS
jgi:predicted HD superfamily hydrolase involved in NAD metabolism